MRPSRRFPGCILPCTAAGVHVVAYPARGNVLIQLSAGSSVSRLNGLLSRAHFFGTDKIEPPSRTRASSFAEMPGSPDDLANLLIEGADSHL